MDISYDTLSQIREAGGGACVLLESIRIISESLLKRGEGRMLINDT